MNHLLSDNLHELSISSFFHKIKEDTPKLSSAAVVTGTFKGLSSTDPSQILYSKTYLKRPLKKKTKIGFQTQLSLNAGQKYCRMLQGEHSAVEMQVKSIAECSKGSILQWKCRSKVLQNAPRGAFCNTFDLH